MHCTRPTRVLCSRSGHAPCYIPPAGLYTDNDIIVRAIAPSRRIAVARFPLSHAARNSTCRPRTSHRDTLAPAPPKVQYSGIFGRKGCRGRARPRFFLSMLSILLCLCRRPKAPPRRPPVAPGSSALRSTPLPAWHTPGAVSPRGDPSAWSGVAQITLSGRHRPTPAYSCVLAFACIGVRDVVPD